MRELYAGAATPHDFTVKKIAAKAGVTTVYVYSLAGTAFQEMKSQLPPSGSSPQKTSAKELHKKIRILEKELREAKAPKEYALSELIEVNEELDQENRVLRA
jgi:hypothetical protein